MMMGCADLNMNMNRMGWLVVVGRGRGMPNWMHGVIVCVCMCRG